MTQHISSIQARANRWAAVILAELDLGPGSRVVGSLPSMVEVYGHWLAGQPDTPASTRALLDHLSEDLHNHTFAHSLADSLRAAGLEVWPPEDPRAALPYSWLSHPFQK